MKFFSWFSTIATLFLFTGTCAQNTYNKTDSIGKLFKTLIHKSGKEEIMVQTDREMYTAGEKIWFKAIVVNAKNNRVDPSSKNLFIDITDDQDSIITKLVLNNRQLNTSGSFKLPDSLKTGFYWVRSYTSKMLAEDAESIFIQPVLVVNKLLHDESAFNRKYINAAGKRSKNQPVIHFFPERLTAIPAIISTGVLQIVDEGNNVANMPGTLINDHDSVITAFTTNQFGLARIEFIDDPAQKYTAVFHVNDHDMKYTIPSVNSSGAQLSFARQTAKNIKAFVTLEDSLAPDFRATILGLHGDSLCYAAIGTGTYGINIPLDNFPGGISTFLLLDEQQHLLAERKIFIDKGNYQLEVHSNKKNYKAREGATLDISMTDPGGTPVPASFNISVQDAVVAKLSDSIEVNDLPPANELLLKKWLVRHSDKYAPGDIDMLMMTIKSSFKNSTPVDTSNEELPYDSDERLLNLTGNITDHKNRPVKERMVTAIAKNQSTFFINVDTTKADGSFKIALPQYMDSMSVSLQVTDKYGTDRNEDSLTTNDFVFPAFTTPVSLRQQFLKKNINMLALLQKYHYDTAMSFQGNEWLKPVTIVAAAKPELNYDETKRLSSISQVLTSDKFRYGGYGAIGNALLTVPGISLSGGDISIFGPSLDMKGHIGRPLLIVDGVAMGSAGLEYFNSLAPADVEFIEVLRGAEAGIYGARSGDGVISVNTRRGSSFVPNTRNIFRSVTPVTYHSNPPFIMPDYSNPEIKDKRLPDLRTTIYWNGNVMTDSTGHATLSFYTADKATEYAVTITGLSPKGDIIHKKITLRRN